MEWPDEDRWDTLLPEDWDAVEQAAAAAAAKLRQRSRKPAQAHHPAVSVAHRLPGTATLPCDTLAGDVNLLQPSGQHVTFPAQQPEAAPLGSNADRRACARPLQSAITQLGNWPAPPSSQRRAMHPTALASQDQALRPQFDSWPARLPCPADQVQSVHVQGFGYTGVAAIDSRPANGDYSGAEVAPACSGSWPASQLSPAASVRQPPHRNTFQPAPHQRLPFRHPQPPQPLLQHAGCESEAPVHVLQPALQQTTALQQHHVPQGPVPAQHLAFDPSPAPQQQQVPQGPGPAKQPAPDRALALQTPQWPLDSPGNLQACQATSQPQRTQMAYLTVHPQWPLDSPGKIQMRHQQQAALHQASTLCAPPSMPLYPMVAAAQTHAAAGSGAMQQATQRPATANLGQQGFQPGAPGSAGTAAAAPAAAHQAACAQVPVQAEPGTTRGLPGTFSMRGAAQMPHGGAQMAQNPARMTQVAAHMRPNGVQMPQNTPQMPHCAPQMTEGAVHKTQQRTALCNIQQRICQFREQLHRMPPRPPAHDRCPGVYKRGEHGCGGALRYVAAEEGPGFWGCSTWPECAYREDEAPRLLNPHVAMEVVSRSTFKVGPAQGAEDIVAFCGGTLALLSAADVDTSLAIMPDHPRQADTAAASGTPEAPAGGGPQSGGPHQKQGEQHSVDGVSSTAGGQHVLFSFDSYDRVRSALVNQQRHRLELTDTRHYSGLIPEATLSAFRGTAAAREAPEEVQRRYACLPAYLQAALLPFQREGVRYALERRGRVLIADEMGVGKTVQAIALSSCYQDEWPMLVIVPASLRLVWAEELEKWLPHLRPCHIHVIEGKTDRLQGQDLPQVVITSYEMMSRLTCDACRGGSVAGAPRMECTGPEHCMAAKGWAVVIADESHTLRTTNHAPDARHTEAVCSAAQRAKRAIFLSGTPSLTRPFDLFRQVDAIRPGLLGFSREAFAQRYCNRRLVACGRRGEDRKRWDNSGLARAGELHSLLKQEVMLRRMKREVLSQLPPKRRQVVRLPRPRPQDWPKEGKAKSAADGEDTSGSESEGEEAAPVGMEAASPKDEPEQEQRLSKDHCTGIAKLPNVIEWLMHALGGRESGGAAGSAESRGAAGVGGSAPAEAPPKFLIFAHHRTVMSRLASALEGNSSDWAGIAYVRIEGATDPVERRLAVQRFRDDPSVRVALLSVTAAGTGLDFSAASAVVFAELPRDVALVRQAEDRAHRQGQRFPVNVYFLVARGTSDDRRWQHLNRSLERVSAVHDAADGADARGLAVDRVCTINGKGDWDRLDAAGNAGSSPAAANAPGPRTAPADTPSPAAAGAETPDARGTTPTAAVAATCVPAAATTSPAATAPAATHASAAAAAAACQAALGHAGAAHEAAAVAENGDDIVIDLTCSQPGDGPSGKPTPSGCSQADDTLLSDGQQSADHSLLSDPPLAGGSLANGEQQSGQDPPAKQAFLGGSPADGKHPSGLELAPAGPHLPLHPAAASGSAEQQRTVQMAEHSREPGLPAEPAERGRSVQMAEHKREPVSPAEPAEPGGRLLRSGALHAGDSHAKANQGQGPAEPMGNTKELAAPTQSGRPPADLADPRDAGHAGESYAGDSHNISDKADGGAAQASARRMAGLAEASLLADGSQAAEVSGSEEGAPKVWFEVSANTNRVHFHSKPNGSAPLGLSLPLELLQMPGTPATLADLLQALDNRPQVAVHVGPAGVLALQPHISRADVEAWVADAREFAAEWVEMRSVFQSKLFGQVLRHPLQDAVEEANAKAQKAGAYGSGTDRYLTGDRSETPLPEGASWQTVRVKYARYGQEVAYKQAFSAGNQRLCVCCLAPVLNCSAPPPAVLHSAVDLFCGPACEARFCMRSGGGALRRAVFRLERGVCTLCKLDCHDLVQRLRTIEKGSHKWEEKRRQRVAKLAPNFCKPGFKAYLDRLVKQALPGNAWHADHIVAVYQGGGLCDLENLRTLCVICHQGVTKAQARERAEARRMRNQSTLDAFLTLSQRQRHQQQPASKPRAKGQAVPLRRPKRAKVARTSTSDSDSDFCQVVAEVAAPPRPAPAAESAKSGQDRDGADQRTGEAANGSSGGGTTAMGGGKSSAAPDKACKAVVAGPEDVAANRQAVDRTGNMSAKGADQAAPQPQGGAGGVVGKPSASAFSEFSFRFNGRSRSAVAGAASSKGRAKGKQCEDAAADKEAQSAYKPAHKRTKR